MTGERREALKPMGHGPIDAVGPSRVVIERVSPEIDWGRFAIKRVVGEKVGVEADIFADGQDALSAMLLYRHDHETQWSEVPMAPLLNDRWRGSFVVSEIGNYLYTVTGWVDPFKTWRQKLLKKAQAGLDVGVDLLEGAAILSGVSARASGKDAARLRKTAMGLKAAKTDDTDGLINLVFNEELAQLAFRHGGRTSAARYPRDLKVVVDRDRARFSSWYEMFPRSCSGQAGRHGTFKDVETKLPYVASMGFDVLYLTPIHPIGLIHRKGRNNTPSAGPDDPGSPWAMGSAEGGHKAIHPQLGTLKDFRHLVSKAGEYGLEIALDLAFQCAPDHPYVTDHPEWFRHRPDGTIQYAENPPKSYEDIYPIYFETEQWRELWEELKSVVLFWIKQGVHIFRVDNPHTKPLRLWEWLIASIKDEFPQVIFLSEAFTRPKVMYELSKLGFTQSYSYFTWRNAKGELTQYFTELNQAEVAEHFRPNLWPNTPDILNEYLQFGGRPAFMTRLILAATLGASYGIYGPAFELCENRPREPGSEEYLDSEKYQIKYWDIERQDSLKALITKVNQIRRENPALQSDRNLKFHQSINDQIICYSKAAEDLSNVIVVVVNLEHRYTQSGWVELSLQELDVGPQEAYQMEDLLTGARYMWSGPRNYVELDPQSVPAHIFRLQRRVRTEHEFDYHI